MWFGTYQLGSRQHGRGAHGESEAQSGREGEILGRHIFVDVEYKARRNECWG